MTHGDLTGRALGEFVLGARIGEGGHGVVYRAHQRALGRDVVIKVLRAQRRNSAVAQERFLREAQLASLLEHPYAAHIYAFGVEPDGLMWIAMELVHGITLQEWLVARGPVPLDELVPFIEHVAQVVHAAHQHGIVHRDLKPSNMMVIESGGDLFPKLLDFGIAKAPADIATLAHPVCLSSAAIADITPDCQDTAQLRGGVRRSERTTVTGSNADREDHPGVLTRPGSGIGSSAYMSPEQWHDAWMVGPAADIYALGVIVYRALAGVEPFVGEHTGEYFHQHHDVAPPRLGGDLAPVDRVIQRALAKAPDDRHPTTLELAADLRAALRASEREQLRTAAQQWDDRRRSPGLLWGREELPNLARLPLGKLSPLECSFVAASQRRARRATWLRRALLVAAIATIAAGFQFSAAMRARLAEETAAQAVLEQGRSALLRGEPQAAALLARAYRHTPSPTTAFMLARSIEPKLAELARLPAASGRAWSGSFSPTGKQLAVTDARTARLFDAETFKLQHELRHKDEVYDAVFSRNGARLFTVATDAVRIWNTSTGELVQTLSTPRHDGAASDYYLLALSPDERLIAAIDASGAEAHMWNVETGATIARLSGDASEFPALAFSPDGGLLALSGGDDVRVFDTRTAQRVSTISGPRIRWIAFDPVGSHLVTGAATGDVATWDPRSGARVRHLRDVGDPVDVVTYSPDGALVAAACRDGTQLVWDVVSGELVTQLNPRHSKIRMLSFDSTSKLLLSAGTDGTAVIASVELGMPTAVLEGPRGVLWTARFNPAGDRVIGASWDGFARVWSSASQYRVAGTRPMSDNCGIVTTAEPDARYIAVTCKKLPVRIWDTSRDRLLAELPSGNPGIATAAASPTGTLAAVAHGDTLDIYSIPNRALQRSIRHGEAVTAVAFSADGDVVSGSKAGDVIISRRDGARVELPGRSAIDAIGFLSDGRIITADASGHFRVYDRGGTTLAELELPARMMAFRIDGNRVVGIPLFTGNATDPVLIDVRGARIVGTLSGHIGRVFSVRWTADHQLLSAGSDGTVRLWNGNSGALLRIFEGNSRLLSDADMTPDGLVVAGGAEGVVRFWDRDSGRQLWGFLAHASQVIGVHVDGASLVTRGIAGEVTRWAIPPAAASLNACAAREACVIVLR